MGWLTIRVMAESEDNQYTIGGDPTLFHCRLLGHGGSGVVHEVQPEAIHTDR